MNDKYEVIWEAEDGYVGGSRPHTLKLNADDCNPYMSDAELQEHLYELVDEDFHQRVSYNINNMEEALEWMKARRDEALKEEQ